MRHYHHQHRFGHSSIGGYSSNSGYVRFWALCLWLILPKRFSLEPEFLESRSGRRRTKQRYNGLSVFNCVHPLGICYCFHSIVVRYHLTSSVNVRSEKLHHKRKTAKKNVILIRVVSLQYPEKKNNRFWKNKLPVESKQHHCDCGCEVNPKGEQITIGCGLKFKF